MKKKQSSAQKCFLNLQYILQIEAISLSPWLVFSQSLSNCTVMTNLSGLLICCAPLRRVYSPGLLEHEEVGIGHHLLRRGSPQNALPDQSVSEVNVSESRISIRI